LTVNSERDAANTTPSETTPSDSREGHGRDTAWRREDQSEESTAHGTRADLGQSGGMREDSAPSPGFAQERGPAGSVSDAATETGVSEHSAEAPPAQRRSLDDFGRDGNDRLQTGGHNSATRDPTTRREDPGNTLDALNNASEAAPQKPG
jgi:hypothetical protein